MPAYLDALDVATDMPCQVQLDDDSVKRERARGMFSMTDAPRGDCPVRARNVYGWFPVKRAD